jgi:chaperonin cofactor prefoldin
MGSVLAADLPVKEVVLYKNGVGYFRRGGELAAGDSARLDFKAADMNDVLKSLTILEEGGGKITGLRYDSSEPLARKLSEFPFQLGEQQPLSALLDQLKGARVELTLGAGKSAGIILGARQESAEEKQPPLEQVTLLLDAGELRTYDLASITGVRFTDPVLQSQLQAYLASLVVGRSKEKRSVYIDSTQAQSRRISATYVVPTPIWKSSYRLILPESGEPMLEGWAIVDNTSGEDWTKVRLALVSGRPVSFISRLYEPRYLQRQVAELPEDQAARPEVYEGGVGPGSGGGIGHGVYPPPPPPPSAGLTQFEQLGLVSKNDRFTRADRSSIYEGPVNAPQSPSSIAAAAEGHEMGELFEYSFSAPVTVRKDESAMLPFLQQTVTARKLLVYSRGGSEFPRNAAEITNSTGKTLDGGPITVYDGNAYAGEALVETVKAGDKRLISYAIDLGTRISTATDSSSDFVREIHVSRGVMTTRSTLQETTTYSIRNVDQKPKTLMLEHAIRPGYKLLKLKPAETTASAYRFEVKLAGGASEKFPVAEERVFETSVTLANVTPDYLLVYVKNKALDEAARKQLEGISSQKQAVAANDGDIRAAEQQLGEVVQDEQRVRDNIGSLNRVSGQQDLVQKYARQLSDQETRIASLRDQLSELRKKKAALESDLNSLIDKMEF